MARRPVSLKNVKNRVANFIEKVPKKTIKEYTDYFNKVAPESDEDFFRRWLFAWASIQTTWERNCILYNKIKDLDWLHSKEALHDRVVDAAAGMHNSRTRYIWDFRQKFWDDPDFYRKKGHRTWEHYRKDLIKNILGMGHTKCAFVCEMSFPEDTEVVCLDTHMLKLMGYTVASKAKLSYAKYRELEEAWVDTCLEHNVPPAIGRAIYWDRLQGKQDSSYWCHVFHDERLVPA